VTLAALLEQPAERSRERLVAVPELQKRAEARLACQLDRHAAATELARIALSAESPRMDGMPVVRCRMMWRATTKPARSVHS
jgi:hypothetical protein